MAKGKTSSAPFHLGLILDGNRRWARANGKTTFYAHKLGYTKIKHTAELAIDKGVKFVSVFAFSTENWNRTKAEVSYLMDLALWVATEEVDELHEKNIRVLFLGSTQRLSSKMIKAIRAAEDKTKNNGKGTLCVCFNYGGHQEIVDAAKKIIASGVAADSLTSEVFAQQLYAPEVPPIDLLIRTSGEQRLSNFMLWRAAYAELYFVTKHWPEFKDEDLEAAFVEFSKRQRRHGR